MAQFFQITEINSSGQVMVLHPESNADNILTGSTFRVPTILNINDWVSKSEELVSARKGKASLVEKINEIDTALQASELLKAIKTVDGANSGLDADLIDGKNVSDDMATLENIWTANKTNLEISKRLMATEVVTSPTAGKVLRLNADGKMATDLIGNADTATSFKSPVSINLIGDVLGSFIIRGNETSATNVNIEVKDNSHNHNSITNGTTAINVSSSDIADFIKNGKTVSKIESNGNFTGSANAVNGLSVNNNVSTNSLWSSDKINKELATIQNLVNAMILTDEAKGTIKLGDIIINYGKINLATKSNVTAIFGTPFKSKILFDSFSLGGTDMELKCLKNLATQTLDKIDYTLNKTATNGVVTWFAVGM